MSNVKERVIAEIEALKPHLIAISDTIHANPEIGYQEFKTSELLCNELERAGFEVTRGICGMPTAFKAVYRGRADRPAVALLAEMDALPGLGHACGHNIIGAASLGAALALSRVMGEVNGTAMVFGTPAEESVVDNACGKPRMLDEIKNADAAMLVHPGTKNTVKTLNVCREALLFKFYGKSAHAGAAPHLGVNALDAAIATFNMVNALRQHVRMDVRIHGIITKGGDSPNVVPDYAEIRLYVRAKDPAYLEETVKRVNNCAQGAALGTGARVEISTYASRDLNMVSNPTLADLFKRNWETLGVNVEEVRERSYGSSDMGNVSQVIPAIHPTVAIAPEGTPGHSAAFREAARSEKGHQGLILAAKGLAMTAVDLFTRPEAVERMKRDFEDFKSGKWMDY
ncbi:MAG: M20 family metallopeptidase [Candidatus Bathyarchaeia archaeon]